MSRVFRALPLLSLLFFIASIAIWVHSYWFFDEMVWWNGKAEPAIVAYRKAPLISCQGGIVASWSYTHVPTSTAALIELDDFKMHYPHSVIAWDRRMGERDFRDRYFNDPGDAHPLGFQAGESSNPFYVNSWMCVPFWFLTTLFALAPTIEAAYRIRRYRRGKRGLCPKCGYDLRHNSGRCPECGVPVKEGKNSRV